MEVNNSTSARTLVVGDIHGCFDELLALINAAGISEFDRIVCVGDLIDRGPQSWEVVDFFRSKPDVRQSVCGNHEWKHILHADDPNFPSRQGAATRRSIGSKNYTEAIEYFRALPLWLDLPEVLVVHAGIDPILLLEETDPKLIMGVNSRNRVGFDGLSPWWFDDTRLLFSKPVVFGHHVFPNVARGVRGNVWGINTGAGYGAPLTGLLLPEFRIVSVPTANHIANIRRRWQTEDDLREIPQLGWEKIFQLLETPDELPAPALALMEEARDDFSSLLEHLAKEGDVLKAFYNVDNLSDQQKAMLFRFIGSSAHFKNSYGRCALKVLQGHSALVVVRKQFPTPKHLREAASEGWPKIRS